MQPTQFLATFTVFFQNLGCSQWGLSKPLGLLPGYLLGIYPQVNRDIYGKAMGKPRKRSCEAEDLQAQQRGDGG